MQYKIGQRVLVHLDETFLTTLGGNDWIKDTTIPGRYVGTIVSTDRSNTHLTDYDWDNEYPLVVVLPSDLFVSECPLEYHRVSFTEHGSYFETPEEGTQGVTYPTLYPYTVLKPVRT